MDALSVVGLLAAISLQICSETAMREVTWLQGSDAPPGECIALRAHVTILQMADDPPGTRSRHYGDEAVCAAYGKLS